MVEYYCKHCDIKTDLSECPNCHQRTELKGSSIFWCDECRIPLYDQICPVCGSKAKRISSDLRPVFPEERLLMEIVLGEPLKYKDCSVWSSASNYYLIDGKRVDFNLTEIQNIGVDKVREELEKYSAQNDYDTQGGLPIIATTHETGKNLTNPNLRFVIHYDVPERNVYDIHVSQLAYSSDSVVYDLVVSQNPTFNEMEKVNSLSENTEVSEFSENTAISEQMHTSGKNLYHETQEGTFRSWTVLNQETAVKTCDDDFIFGNASGVPKDMCGFFDADEFVNGQSSELTFIYEKQSYSAKVSADYSPSRRIKIRWDAKLGREFKRLNNLDAITKVSFHRCGNKTYELTVI